MDMVAYHTGQLVQSPEDVAAVVEAVAGADKQKDTEIPLVAAEAIAAVVELVAEERFAAVEEQVVVDEVKVLQVADQTEAKMGQALKEDEPQKYWMDDGLGLYGQKYQVC